MPDEPAAAAPILVRAWLEALCDLASGDLRLTSIEPQGLGMTATYRLFVKGTTFARVETRLIKGERRIVAEIGRRTVDEALPAGRPVVWE